MTARIRVKKDARHVPHHHRGDEGEIMEQKKLSFGQLWYLVRFEDGCECWLPPERTEAEAAGAL